MIDSHIELQTSFKGLGVPSSSLDQLLAGFTDFPVTNQCIEELEIDSRKVTRGDLFFALPGNNTDGIRYIDEAIERGASAILYESVTANAVKDQYPIPVIPIANLSYYVGLIAARFYHYPSKKLKIIAVTGTNGKTSCVFFLAQALQNLGKKCAVIGTLGVRVLDEMHQGLINNTTPDAVSLQRCLFQFVQQNLEYVAIEASSHGLEQHRLVGVEFIGSIFTNISRDHLDYHKTMDAYISAKKKLFHWPNMKFVVMNLDDAVGVQFHQELQLNEKIQLCGYQRTGISNFGIIVTYEHFLQQPLIIKLQACSKKFLLKTQVFGEFNVLNILAVIASLLLLDFIMPQIVAALQFISGPTGRMQKISKGRQPTVIIDFAHSPDALEVVLKTLRLQIATEKKQSSKLICIFGCGGSRDIGKRAMMGSIAAKYADLIVLTSDNPRQEDPEKICNDILAGITDKSLVQVIIKRDQAIQSALSIAREVDVVLIAGKGHEMYQEIGCQKFYFSDFDVVGQCLEVWSPRIET